MPSTPARLLQLCALALLSLVLTPALSQARSRHHHPHAARTTYHPPQSAIVINASTDRVLYAQAPDAPRYPASLTKLMTLYLTFDALDRGRLRLDEEIPVSAHAAAQEPSKIGFAPGSEITVRQAILSIVTKSANDAAVILAEALGGSEDHFATLMNAKARSLGMRHTVFENASGLPNPRQHTTARDMATLALAILHHHRKYYHFFSVRSFVFEGRTIYGHDHLLGSYPGADGLKTGYIHASGFNLVTSAKQGNTRLIGVVFGGITHRSRDAEMRHLLTVAFHSVDHHTKLRAAEVDAPRPIHGPRVALQQSPSGSRHPMPQLRPFPHPLTAPHRSARERWGIQVGAYDLAKLATRQAKRAIKAAPEVLDNDQVGIEVPKGPEDKLYRARLAGLSEDQARTACRILERKQVDCFVFLQ